MVQPIAPSIPRIFTFTYQNQRISIPLPDRYDQVSLIHDFTPEGKPNGSLLMARRIEGNHFNFDCIAKLIKGEWISTIRS